MPRTFWVETLGCPKNQVDSDKLAGTLLADGLSPADAPDQADYVVVNTCAFIEEARQESIDTVLAMSDAKAPSARLVVTGCMAERYGAELAGALHEVDLVAGFGVPVTLTTKAPGRAVHASPVADIAWRVPAGSGQVAGRVEGGDEVPGFDLLNLPRPPSTAPWAYVKVAEGCDRSCGFCAIPSFRGKQRSRSIDDVVREVDQLAVREVVLVAQDLASFGRDQGQGERSLVELIARVSERTDRVRLLYLYPSELTDELVDAILGTGVPYFDLSLQHVSASLLRSMRRWGDGDRFSERIAAIRAAEPDATFRSNFIIGYPGETEADHDQLLEFIGRVRLDWCGFFAYSREDDTHAAGLGGVVHAGLVAERLAELGELQDSITASRRDELIGREVEVLVDEPGFARSHREAPEIDGTVIVPGTIETGTFTTVEIVDALGPDLVGRPLAATASAARPDRACGEAR